MKSILDPAAADTDESVLSSAPSDEDDDSSYLAVDSSGDDSVEHEATQFGNLACSVHEPPELANTRAQTATC